MDRSKDESSLDDKRQNSPFDGGGTPALSSNLFLDNVGEVVLTHTSEGLSWKTVEPVDNDNSVCLGIKLDAKFPNEIEFSDVYAVELNKYGLIRKSNLPNAGDVFWGRERHQSKMYRFTVHGFQKSNTQPCLWILTEYTFGHKDLTTCEMWVNGIEASLNEQVGRPKNLLVFVHPRSGKGNGRRIWENVAPIFSRAKVKTKVIVTERAGQAYDVMTSITNRELCSYDGVVTVGGDGFFNEILNGFLSSRHKAPYPPAPSDFVKSLGNTESFVDQDPKETSPRISCQNGEEDPLILPSTEHNGSQLSDLHQDPEFSLPNEWFRFGIIPAGSTDAIVICTTGVRDHITSALHIVLGKRICLDVAQIVRWRTTAASKVEPCIRYATSFSGYGFYGDVISESEKYRWMGPKRYDYAGTKVFLKHRLYEAEVAYLEAEPENTNPIPDRGRLLSRVRTFWSPNKSERMICRTNCTICNTKPSRGTHLTPYSRPEERRWSRSKGHFLSIAAAIISNRNERAPDGLVVDAHLSDGFLHLVLVKDCPHALYLWHLTELARRHGDPLNFEFVEHHKTTAFTFTSYGDDSAWNLDGELFQAHQLSAQVFRGLISLFASGPEV